MQLIPRFQQWITEYYPGTKLAFSEYPSTAARSSLPTRWPKPTCSGSSGASGWISPTCGCAGADRSHRLRVSSYRNYNGQGGQFGNTSVLPAAPIKRTLHLRGLRPSDGALTLIVINKTTSPIQTSLSLAHFTPDPSASVYSYSGANLQKIIALGNIPITPAGFSYNFPAYSATVFAVTAPAPALPHLRR